MILMDHADTLTANQGKDIRIAVGGNYFDRYAIRTHFVTVGEDLFQNIEKYVLPHYQPGDILSMGEKVVSLCQKDVVFKEDIRITPLARLFSRYAYKNPSGPAMDNVYKMQTAINSAGAPRVMLGAFLSAITKPFGIHGVFYNVVGHGARNIDGFCVVGFEYYADKGVLAPSHPDATCDEVKKRFGIDCMIVDANDLSVQILGTSSDNPYSKEILANIIRDNPAGQGRQQTPFILIRPALQ
jgi:F420-0:gamma-glutamyl ligase-like protein